ncbi:1,4-alpha-glucan branching protein GlgB [Alkalicella caledoniensis]|uniref:1,4-alpha-glucan branching enzyme GlgB n=1 Tax=Alkalicella caledoniensis TaxID=2731377 RepID=A0A7G9W432_ALKCA|nr:1,4-alpha-glucan branching protein GlgB [Alkalicella caledoniensis]QNO13444.1 1,4-alpha-glucan branching protein GlgB [Alkalicella caledoniensis]
MNKKQIQEFHQGNSFHAYKNFGAHLTESGTTFTLWAPKAKNVAVVGDFNSWNPLAHPMKQISPGIWTMFIPNIKAGEIYKYSITTPEGQIKLKADPYAFYSELRPATASVVADIDTYPWQDQKWQQKKKKKSVHQGPLNIYELHLGTWKTKKGQQMNYKEIAAQLIPYIKEMGYTHIEIMPIMEHPFDGSWGYQLTGYYSVTSRYGGINDLKSLIEQCHRNNIGVILDWVPSHFCRDDHGLRMLDGTPCYESHIQYLADNPQWGTSNFDYSKGEVLSFLISNAIYWIEEFHADGLRVDAVANILYLDFCKTPNEHTINEKGTNENLYAIEFLKKLNTTVDNLHPNTLMIAEDSSLFQGVTKKAHENGLGFSYKWNLGWMNDTLHYMQTPVSQRVVKHHQLTHPMTYSFSEKFLLPLSHDEVVHGKKSLLEKMEGDQWQKFASLKAYYGFKMAHPGKKLLFMGGEFGQKVEWRDYEQLQWQLLEEKPHKLLQQYVKELNHLYKNEKTLWEQDYSWNGFQWLQPDDTQNSIYAYQRIDKERNILIVISNFTPTVHHKYTLKVTTPGTYQEIFNSDLPQYGGSNLYNPTPKTTQKNTLTLLIPPLATIYLKLKK